MNVAEPGPGRNDGADGGPRGGPTDPLARAFPGFGGNGGRRGDGTDDGDGVGGAAPRGRGLASLRPALGAATGVGETTVLRPSLWAALDVVAKIAAVLLGFFLPVLLGAWLTGHGFGFAAALTAFASAEAFNLFYGVLAALFPMAQLAFTRYVIDDEGVRVRTDLLSRSERRVQWDKVTMLRHRRTLVDRVFGIERLDVIAYGERGTTLHLVGLRGAGPLRDRFSRCMRQHASVGGRLGED